MALSQNSVQKAVKILMEINPQISSETIIEYNDSNKKKLNVILGFDKKSDGGYESLVTNIKDIKEEQTTLFESRHTEIPNAPVHNQMERDITRIGWF